MWRDDVDWLKIDSQNVTRSDEADEAALFTKTGSLSVPKVFFLARDFFGAVYGYDRTKATTTNY